jgi:hypothetical protein
LNGWRQFNTHFFLLLSREKEEADPALEPHILDAFSVLSHVVEGHQSVEVFHGNGGHRFWFGEPQVDGDAAPAVLAGFA